MSFPAKYPGKCKRCKQAIKVGQDIQTPTRQPFVHTGCIQVMSPEEAKIIKDLVDDLIDEGFTCHSDGYWTRCNTEVNYVQIDDELVVQVIVAGIELRVYDPSRTVEICNVLEQDRAEVVDEFDEYRKKLQERYEQ